ncbi:alanine dehydrogenase [Virgibacillus soli]|uniref:alanine dehydrogenase n=1 Tax=Paracerasibacillus soli TaxID=480284 RepID=UPI0035F0602B
MKIGVPKEILNHEDRVAMTPAGIVALKSAGHEVYVETNAGIGSGFTDESYEKAGATIVATAKEAWAHEIIMKVKEPQPSEFGYFYKGQILFTYLHLANEEELTKELVKHEITSIAYETVQLDNGALPLLTPMSEVAGRMATQIGAQFLEKSYGGKGVLLAGIPGVKRAKVTVIGGGVVGTNAAKVAIGLGADVTLIDLNPERLRYLDEHFGANLKTIMSNPMNIAESVAEADLVIGAVLIPGSRAPKLVTEEMVKAMSPGSVIVDVAIDQGGVVATSDRVTTHDHPTYTKHGILHYAVANMPGAVPRTSTLGLTNVTVPYVLQIANNGLKQACEKFPELIKGINTYKGSVTHKGVAEAHQMELADVLQLL